MTETEFSVQIEILHSKICMLNYIIYLLSLLWVWSQWRQIMSFTVAVIFAIIWVVKNYKYPNQTKLIPNRIRVFIFLKNELKLNRNKKKSIPHIFDFLFHLTVAQSF